MRCYRGVCAACVLASCRPALALQPRLSLLRTTAMTSTTTSSSAPIRRTISTKQAAPTSGSYPAYPRGAVSVCIARPAGAAAAAPEYLLVQRGKEPGKGKWSLCGGSIALGETTLSAARRELLEETCMDGASVRFCRRPFGSSDAIYHDEGGAVAFHYVIQHVYGLAASGTVAEARDDAAAAGWFSLAQVREMGGGGGVAGAVADVIAHAERLRATGCLPVEGEAGDEPECRG